MNEKHEKWIIFALIALALWWLFKKYSVKGQTAVVSNVIGGVPGDSQSTYYAGDGAAVRGPVLPANPVSEIPSQYYSWRGGSIVNPTHEVIPPTATAKPFVPAQPSTSSPARLPARYVNDARTLAVLRY